MSTLSREQLTLETLRASSAPAITMKTAAEVMGCDPRTISVGVQEGTIPAIKLGRRVVIPREKFLKLFEAD